MEEEMTFPFSPACPRLLNLSLICHGNDSVHKLVMSHVIWFMIHHAYHIIILVALIGLTTNFISKIILVFYFRSDIYP